MKGALWVCERDLRKFIRRPTTMAASLIGPFLTLVLLGYAFGGKIENIPVAVVSESDGPYSSALTERMSLEKTFRLVYVSQIDQARRMLQDGKVKAVIYFPQGFDAAAANNHAFVNIYVDNTDPASSNAIRTAAAQVITRSQPTIEVRQAVLAGLSYDVSELYRKVEYIEFMAPGSIVQAVFFASIIGGGIAILIDKERGVIEGYLVTPLRQSEIVIGVLLAGVVKAMFSAMGILTLAVVVAGVRPHPSLEGGVLLVLTVFLTGLGLISMMTAYAVRAPAPEVYQFTSFPVNFILYFTSGAVWPVEGFPWWMRSIATVNPEAYAVHALRSVMYKGVGFAAIAPDLAFLAVFTLIMIGFATFAFKRVL